MALQARVKRAAQATGRALQRAGQALRTRWKQHLGTLALALVVLAAVDAWRTRDLPQGPAPDFAVALSPTGETTLAQWRARHPGQAVALHFWAEWCPVCRIEEPTVAQLAQDWPVLGVAMQSGDAARVAQVQRQRGMAWPTAVDPQAQIARAWGVPAVPAFVVIDAAGQVRSATVGYTPGWSMRLRMWWAQTVPRWRSAAPA
ncbi:redoxin domain-containing protein [Acidovorax sp. SRB_24]|uniref:redoxin domain-containing protein n=1 Tax=Acidovorax sp. SRB_24 TaxID=1962700 RepID=UPI00145EE728|nr:redoxin domain-containing protein [Acidovorax sp. SRB_24]